MGKEITSRVVIGSIIILFILALLVLYAVGTNPFFVLIVGAGVSIFILLIVTIVLGVGLTSDIGSVAITEKNGRLYDFGVIEGIEDYYEDSVECKE